MRRRLARPLSPRCPRRHLSPSSLTQRRTARCNPLSLKGQTRTRLLLHHSGIKPVNIMQREDHIHTYTCINSHAEVFFFFFSPPSASAFKEQPCAHSLERRRVGVEGVRGCWLAWQSVILQVARRLRLLLPITNYSLPEDSHTCKTHYIFDRKTQAAVGSLFFFFFFSVSDSGRQLKQFAGNALTNCWFKRDRSGKATTIMGLLFISLYEAITISILALYIM